MVKKAGEDQEPRSRQFQDVDGVEEIRRSDQQLEGVPVHSLPFPVYPIRQMHL